MTEYFAGLPERLQPSNLPNEPEPLNYPAEAVRLAYDNGFRAGLAAGGGAPRETAAFRAQLAQLATEMEQNADRMEALGAMHAHHGPSVSAAGSSATASRNYAVKLRALLTEDAEASKKTI